MHLFKRATSKPSLDRFYKRRTISASSDEIEREIQHYSNLEKKKSQENVLNADLNSTNKNANIKSTPSLVRKRSTSQMQNQSFSTKKPTEGASNTSESSLEEELIEPLPIDPYYRARSSKVFDLKLPDEYLIINLTPYTFLRGKQLYPIENIQHLLSTFHMLYLHVIGEDQSNKGKIVFYGDSQLQYFVIAAFHFYAFGTNAHFIFVERPSIKRYLLFFEQSLTTHISECNMSKLESIEFSTKKFNLEKLSSLVYWLPKPTSDKSNTSESLFEKNHSFVQEIDDHLEFFFNLSQNGRDVWTGKPLKKIPQLNDTTKYILIDSSNLLDNSSMKWMIGDYQLDMYMKVVKTDGSVLYQRVFKYTLNTLMSLRDDIDLTISRSKIITSIVLPKKQLEIDPGMSDLLQDDFVLTLHFVRAHGLSSAISFEELKYLQDMERLISMAPYCYAKNPSILKQMRIGHVPKAHRANIKLLNQEFFMHKVRQRSTSSSQLSPINNLITYTSPSSMNDFRTVLSEIVKSGKSLKKTPIISGSPIITSPISPIRSLELEYKTNQDFIIPKSPPVDLLINPQEVKISDIPPPPINTPPPLSNIPPPPSMPSIGIPPPLPSFFNSSNNVNNFTNSKKLKKIHWKVIRPNSEDSFWKLHKQEIDSISVDVDKIEFLFDNSSSLKVNHLKKEVSSPKSPAVGSINLLGVTRLQNVEIMLKQFKHFDKLEESLLNILSNLNSEMLTDAQLIALKKIIPTDDERKSLLEYNGDVAKLNFANRFMKAICSSFRWQEKVDTLIYMREFNASVGRLTQYLNTKIQAYKQLRNSTHLSKIMEMALVVGNILNRDNPKLANAEGFSLSDLLKFSQIKAIDKKTTPLHYIATQLHQNGNNLIDLKNELSSLGSACEIEQNIIQLLSDEIGSMSLHFYNESKNYQLENETYKMKVNSFKMHTDQELLKLKELSVLRLSEYNHLMRYFSEPSTTNDSNQIDDTPFLSNILSIIRVYEKCWKEIEL